MQLVGEREVRGVVKLRFRDVTGNFVVCHRMLASIQKVPPHVVHWMCVVRFPSSQT